MTIDLDALEAAVAEGEKKNFFVAPIVKELIAELRERRAQVDGYRMMIDGLENAAHEERAAVVAWLRANTSGPYDFAEHIERGEHRREEEP
jgi:cytochrome c2